MAAVGGEGSSNLRYFGALVKLFRDLTGMTQAELSEAVGYSLDTVSSVEQGRRPPSPVFVDKVDEVLHANGVLRAGKPHLEREKYRAFFAQFADEERGAVSLQSYEAMVVPGLLQTERYAQAVIGYRCPPFDEEEIERHVAARLERQALLTRKPLPILGFVIDESVLYRKVGGREVLKEQLLHLADCSRLRNLSLQVMHFDSDEQPGLDGSMVLLETAGRQKVAYVEVQGVSQWVSKPIELSVLEARYGIIRAQALTTRDSLALIEKVAGEL
ncbi:helix-turn-helix domain-containing protein [Streptomyces sp. RB6PN25]|uniref:Helix-turn-helix domain-containing protein n=1 Tax=Streptomyces humicola TaxID=2953240 RepID=A0ABT1Q536_9ACTN|nr:helix-turn-helix transcriptional regulator [Streptomyces humicola]MCQ4085041.1 helix-turn-helix domain-containing protein [Streptomyces humicola]